VATGLVAANGVEYGDCNDNQTLNSELEIVCRILKIKRFLVKNFARAGNFSKKTKFCVLGKI